MTHRVVSLLVWTLIALAAACTDRGRNQQREPGADTRTAGAVDPTLDCVKHGYPCTWGEVEPATIERSERLVDEATARLDRGEATTVVASWLDGLPDMGEVQYDSLLIRFRLTRGRPMWVGTPEAGTLGMRSAGQGAPNTRQADPVGDQTPGVRSEKAFLLLDPYRYEFYLDVLSGIIRVEDDASWSLPRLFAGVRDYKCTPGRACRCPDGECYKYVGNNWERRCDPTEPHCRVIENVTLEDFKTWRSYDAIHVATHGSSLCNSPSPTARCGGGIASGKFVRGELWEMAEAHRANQGVPPAYAYWLIEPGIELFPLASPRTACERFTSGTPGYSFVHCDTKDQVWRVYLGVDFFKAVYEPGDLKDKLIFLSSCMSVHGDATLAEYLAGPSDENAVVGWDSLVLNSSASIAATSFYKEWLAGKTAHEAFEIVKSKKDAEGYQLFPDLRFIGGRGIVRGGGQETLLGPHAVLGVAGLSRKRGVETIRLLDPATGIEIPDGGMLPLAGRSRDGGDALDAFIEVVSVDAEEDPAGYAVKVRVDGHDAPAPVVFNFDAGSGTHRYRGPFPLGVDLKPERRINVEVSADLPDGGETRWLYYDLLPRHTWWRVEVTGGPVAFPILTGRRVGHQMHVVLGMADPAGAEPDLSPLPPLTIGVQAGKPFVEGANKGLVTVHFRDLGYTCTGFSGGGFQLTVASVKPLDGVFEGRVICTPGRLDDPSRFKENLRLRFEAHATGRFRAR